MRLDKFINDCTSIGRSSARNEIRSGAVTVDGAVVKKPETAVEPDKTKVCYKSAELHYRQFSYYMMNKPAGYVSARTDNRSKTIIDLMPENLREKLAPVGRLDKDTEGLIIITDDGKLTHDLISPVKHVYKKYYCELRDEINDEDMKKLETGVDIGDGDVTLPAKASYAGDSKDKIYLSICEGRFHQVKRMLYAVGNEVVYLKRESMGDLPLDSSLQKGEFRMLRDDEIQLLNKATGI